MHLYTDGKPVLTKALTPTEGNYLQALQALHRGLM